MAKINNMFELTIKLEAIDAKSTRKYKQEVIKDAVVSYYEKSIYSFIYAITVHNKFYEDVFVGQTTLYKSISQGLHELPPRLVAQLPIVLESNAVSNSNAYMEFMHSSSIPVAMKRAAVLFNYKDSKDE